LSQATGQFVPARAHNDRAVALATAQAASVRESTARSQSAIWFQLVKIWLTTIPFQRINNLPCVAAAAADRNRTACESLPRVSRWAGASLTRGVHDAASSVSSHAGLRATHHRSGVDQRTCEVELVAQGSISSPVVIVPAPPAMENSNFRHRLFLRCRRTAEPFQSSTFNPGTRWNSLVL
jgi:hypothetical protein